jgi:hypothetical protein
MNRNLHKSRFLALSSPLLYLAIGIFITALFFVVELRYGYLHFDTYQYSASVGPQSHGLRPTLLGLGYVEEFAKGSEVSLPGIFWIKRILFSWIPYSLIHDQIFCYLCLLAGAVCASLIVLRRGWSQCCAISIFIMLMTDRTFFANVSGTRPEPLSIFLLLFGYILIQNQRLWLCLLGGICVGYAGTMHVYGLLLAPFVLLSNFVSSRDLLTDKVAIRKLIVSGVGVMMSWLLVVVFWCYHPDAWRLFLENYEIQRSFHTNGYRFFSYINGFRLGFGWLILLLLLVFLIIACRELRASIFGYRSLAVFAIKISCILVIPLAFYVLKTEQYFYGVFLWVSVLLAFPIGHEIPNWCRKLILSMCIMLAIGGMIRMAARVKLGLELKDTPSMTELRLDWLKSRVGGSPRLYYFTYEWDIADQVGVQDVRFYTFPLPTTPTILERYEKEMLKDIPDGAMLLFSSEHADHCPYANKNAFDPRKTTDWQWIETKVWHYDLSPSKPAACVWELWRKKPSL